MIMKYFLNKTQDKPFNTQKPYQHIVIHVNKLKHRKVSSVLQTVTTVTQLAFPSDWNSFCTPEIVQQLGYYCVQPGNMKLLPSEIPDVQIKMETRNCKDVEEKLKEIMGKE